MITFTSETASPRPPAEPTTCPRCERNGAVEVSMRTARVVFYRCAECGHMWIVKTPQPVAD
jgi:DNA-directed RNA polymerase subunit M/transcription elongation factor TFIIS